jgi:hypothetical protein
MKVLDRNEIYILYHIPIFVRSAAFLKIKSDMRFEESSYIKPIRTTVN